MTKMAVATAPLRSYCPAFATQGVLRGARTQRPAATAQATRSTRLERSRSRTQAVAAAKCAISPGVCALTSKQVHTGRTKHAARRSLRVTASGNGAAVTDGNEKDEASKSEAVVEAAKADNSDAEFLPAKQRWLLVCAMALAFFLSNLDKVNMSVAMIPMAEEFGWSSSVKGS